MNLAITGASVVAGVVGAPIDHSLSPVIVNAWIEAAGIDAIYVAFPIAKGRLAPFIGGLRGGAVRGLNITAPFKEEALALADDASEAARRAGAANLLLFTPDGAVTADNTDGVGVLSALKDRVPGFDPWANPIAILGAGGAARGAAAALIAAGTPQVRLVNRTVSRAEDLVRALGPTARAYPLAAVSEALGGAAALINCTPANADMVSTLALSDLPASAVIVDMVYRPLDTLLLRHAKARGLPAVDGLTMLIAQGRPSFESMFGVSPPPIDVRALALAAIDTRR